MNQIEYIYTYKFLIKSYISINLFSEKLELSKKLSKNIVLLPWYLKSESTKERI